MIGYSIRLWDSQLEVLSDFLGRAEQGYLCTSEPTDQLRRLYGIIGIEERSQIERDEHVFKGKYYFFVPDENMDAIRRALLDGEFSKQVPEDDLDVLRFVYERNRELRERHGIKQRYPRFTLTEVAGRTDRGRYGARESLRRLTGILCPCMRRHTVRFKSRRGGMLSKSKRYPVWLLPSVRENLAADMLLGSLPVSERNYRIERLDGDMR